MKNIFAHIILFLLAACLFAGCNDESKGSAASLKKVTVMIYSEYIDPDMITDFQMKTGYKLQLELYEAQEEMIAKLQTAGPGRYDVIIASDVVIQHMAHLGLIDKIDTNKVINRRNIEEHFLNPPYDPSNEYSVPYLWGTTGILYNDSTIAPENVSYSMLFDAKLNKGHFSLLDEGRSMLSLALLACGYDANSTDSKQIKEATELIVKAKKNSNFLGFDGSVSGKDKVLSRMDWAAIVFNGEAMAAIEEDPTLQFAIPAEGSFMWVDAMLLSKKAPNPEGAYAFMDYILDPKIGAMLAKFINYATPNKMALKVIDDEFKNNRVVNPTADEIARMVFLKGIDDADHLYEDAWTIVKTR